METLQQEETKLRAFRVFTFGPIGHIDIPVYGVEARDEAIRVHKQTYPTIQPYWVEVHEG